jgi:hypothetical protein
MRELRLHSVYAVCRLGVLNRAKLADLRKLFFQDQLLRWVSGHLCHLFAKVGQQLGSVNSLGCLVYSLLMDQFVNTWNYLLGAVRGLPLNFVALILAFAAIVVSILARKAAHRQAVAAERQATASEWTFDLQSAALREQAKDTRIALSLAERNASAAESSAKVVADSIVQTRESMQKTLRPYVTVFEIKPKETTGYSGLITNLESGGVPTEVEITVVNNGQTPARQLKVYYDVAVLDDTPQSFNEHADGLRSWMATDIGKDQTRSVYGRFVGRQDILESVVVDGSKKFTVYGAVTYQDMFSNEEHRTAFCHVWATRLQKFFPAGPMNFLT